MRERRDKSAVLYACWLHPRVDDGLPLVDGCPNRMQVHLQFRRAAFGTTPSAAFAAAALGAHIQHMRH